MPWVSPPSISLAQAPAKVPSNNRMTHREMPVGLLKGLAPQSSLVGHREKGKVVCGKMEGLAAA